MIQGLGTDIIEIERIKANIDRYGLRFLDRIFTAKEQWYCLTKKESAVHFAGRFAAKEAVAKALGSGFSGGLSWLDIEIINDEKGKPVVHLSQKITANLAGLDVIISISHCRDYATATAILQK